MNDQSKSTRRTFIKTAVQAGAALSAVSHLACAPSGGPGRTGRSVLSHEASAPPPKKDAYPQVRVAYIGTGGIGGYHIEETTKLGVTCNCYCDVDTAHFKAAAEKFPKAKAYQDYREMLEKEKANYDAVMVGIPDHSHYPATMIAMQLGKHVYTQKPLTHTVWEARELAGAGKKYNVVTQMGNQGHALEGWRLLYEWIANGDLGQVREVHTWTDRPIWPQGVKRPEGEDAVPSTVNWDCWLGPAPQRPFKKDTYHPFKWRGWWDFGCGALGDMACHTMDGLFWALDPGHCSSVEPVAATSVNNETFPTASIIKWEFPRRGSRAAFTAHWYDGGLKPEFPGDFPPDRKLPDTGNLFIGTKASILVSGDYGESPRIFPESKQKEIGKPPRRLTRSPGHVAEWIMACAGEQPRDFPKSNFAYAGPMTETILLGNIALRVGRRLEWDGERMQFTNLPEANAYLTKEYRKGWKF